MPARSLILGFLWRFALVYGLLILPWPGWTALYAEGFRGLGNAIFGERDSECVLYFEPDQETRGLAAVDSRIAIANPRLADKNGNGPVTYLSLNTRSIGWIPTALIIALIMATPIPWRRRALALFWGLLLTEAFVLISVALYIWNESTTISLHVLTPFWKELAADAEYVLITQLGASFSIPVLIWILVTFAYQDRRLLGLTKNKAAK
jgi:hypothetical protein